MKKPPKGMSLAETNSTLAKEWHPTKNDLTPWDIFENSGKIKIWWCCDKGQDHEWEASPNARSGRGCPVCSGKKVVNSNCMATTHPKLAKDFHQTKNGALTPKNILGTYSKKIWWKCDKGPDHEWEASPENRARGTGCAICAGKKIVQSNCLKTTHPKLVSQWHTNKNKNITPEEIGAGSAKKVWWKCDKGLDHEWQASLVKRTNGRNCPFCSGRQVSLTNNLAKLYPELLLEWDYKNNPTSPENVYAGGNKKYWWICKENIDHKWQASISKRGQYNRGCPYCSGNKTNKSNNLVSQFPEIAKEWDFKKNTKYDISQMHHGSETRVWWKCDKDTDHEWEALVSNRTRLGVGCSICAGKMVVKSNCLATTHPKIAAQWHPTKNKNLTANDVILGSLKKVWWKCDKGLDHEWKSRLAHRKIAGCPFCTLTPQSKQELTISFELMLFFDLNPKGFKTIFNDKMWSIDIFIQELNIGFEFDGSYWHKGKREFDKIKTEQLTDQGFKIVRIREEPLKKIFDNDIISKLPYNGKEVTDNILKLLLKTYKLDSQRIMQINNYLNKSTLHNKKALDVYIEAILEEKAKNKSKHTTTTPKNNPMGR
jgi:hypothetical protein